LLRLTEVAGARPSFNKCERQLELTSRAWWGHVEHEPRQTYL
jgi:hypothetical protein